MLVKHFSRNEWEVVVLLSLLHCLLMTLSQFIVKLLLIVEEEEFILEDIRAPHFHGFLLFNFFFDSLQCITLLLEFCFLLHLSSVQFFSHLRKVGFQDVLVGKPIAKGNFLPKLEYVGWFFNLRFRF